MIYNNTIKYRSHSHITPNEASGILSTSVFKSLITHSGTTKLHILFDIMFRDNQAFYYIETKLFIVVIFYGFSSITSYL